MVKVDTELTVFTFVKEEDVGANLLSYFMWSRIQSTGIGGGALLLEYT